MPTKKTSKKAPVKKTSKKPVAKKPKRGTVAWLIGELKKFPGNMYVLHGDHDYQYYEGSKVEVLPITLGEIDQVNGEKVVCINPL